MTSLSATFIKNNINNHCTKYNVTNLICDLRGDDNNKIEAGYYKLIGVRHVIDD